MDGETFYDQFKSALFFFDVSWGDKAEMQVTTNEYGLVYTHDGVSLMIKIVEGGK